MCIRDRPRRNKRKPADRYTTTVTSFTPEGTIRRRWNWRTKQWETLDTSVPHRNIETIDLAGDSNDDEGRKTPDNQPQTSIGKEVGKRPQEGAGPNQEGNGAQNQGDVVHAHQEKVNAARRALFAMQHNNVDHEPKPTQDTHKHATADASSDE